MKKISRVIVKQPIDSVWKIATDSEKFHGLKLPGIYSYFDPQTARKGTSFRYRGLAFDVTYDVYIVEWEPQRVFSFGHSPNDWTFKYLLTDGGISTEIEFSRKFSVGIFGQSFGMIKSIFGAEDEYQSLTNSTTQTLKAACERLSNGKEEGIYVNKWRIT